MISWFYFIINDNECAYTSMHELCAMPADTLKHSELADKVFKTLFLCFIIIFAYFISNKVEPAFVCCYSGATTS